MEPQSTLTKVLIANRGEIAIRVIRSCREQGIATVAIYSDADRDALHVQVADEAIHIGPAPAPKSYLRIENILEAARQTGADAIHPGYGFLSENEGFARAVMEAGLIWIGPTPEVIASMGSKVEARATMEAAGVPVVPGYQGEDCSFERLRVEAEKIGYPILVKASAGGGGKGMRAVNRPEDLKESMEAAKREAMHAFGDDVIFLEKYIVRPRHIEFQILGDQHGNIVHLFERECSIQRRHQKVVEESPSVALDEALRTRMGDAAIAAAAAVGYSNAGTVEFILGEDGGFYFLEMNTRLQVEHPVTEMVVGQDLVALQLAVAQGQPLPFQQGDLTQRGHAIEVRVYAEDPAKGFVPATGTVHGLREPAGPGIRADSCLFPGMVVPIHYDPMLAKLIAWGPDRPTAARRLQLAIEEYAVLGVTTNLPFLRDVIKHPAYLEGDTTTDFISQYMPDWQPPSREPSPEHLAALAVAELLQGESRGPSPSGGEAPLGADPHSPWGRLGSWRVLG